MIQRADLRSSLMGSQRDQRERTGVQWVWARWLIRQHLSTRSQSVQVEPKQEGKGSLSRDQIAGFVPREGEDRENWSEGQDPNVLCLKFGLVNTTNAYRDLLCARH